MRKVEMLGKELIEVRQQLKELKEREEIVKNELLPFLTESEKLIINYKDELFGIEKKAIERSQFNLNLFKETHPKIYQKFIEIQSVTSIFTRKLPLKEQLKISNNKKVRA
jgi:hypothetical protein